MHPHWLYLKGKPALPTNIRLIRKLFTVTNKPAYYAAVIVMGRIGAVLTKTPFFFKTFEWAH